MKQKSRFQCTPRFLFLCICVGVFCWQLLLNCFTPYVADDFYFSLNFATERPLATLGDLVQSLRAHYIHWSGRVVVKFFAQAFTMAPKILFNLCNSAVYVGLGVSLYYLARGRRQKEASPLALLGIFLGLWLASPVFGQTNLWMCGSCNYLWATALCAAALLPWRFYQEGSYTPGKLAPLWGTILSFGAGAASENTSAGLIAGMVFCLIAMLFAKQKPALFQAVSLVGSIAGYLFLVMAPGNYVRADGSEDTRPFLTQLAVRFLNLVNMLEHYCLPLLILIAVFGVLVWYQHRDPALLLWPAILLGIAMTANLAMIGTPYYYPRSTHGLLAFLTAAAVSLGCQLEHTKFKPGLSALAAALCLPAALNMVEAGYDNASYYTMSSQRDALIWEMSENGERDIKTYAITCYSPYCSGYDLPDLRLYDNDSVGDGRRAWYGVDSLTADSVRDYPYPGKIPLYSEEIWELLTPEQLAAVQ